MKYFRLFCIVYSIFFCIGFSFGWKDASKYKFDDYLIQNVRLTVTNINGSKKGIILLYVNNNDTLVRYSVDRDSFIDKSEWIIFNHLDLNKPAFPFLSQLNDVRSYFLEATIASFGAYFLSKAPKTPSAFIEYVKQIDTKLKIEKNSQRVKYIVTSILGSISGFFSGYFFADNVFKPSENSDPTQKKINDINFWKKAKLSMWYAYADDLKNRCIMEKTTSMHTQEMEDRLYDLILRINTTQKITLHSLDLEGRTINSLDFATLHSYEKEVHRINPSDTKLFEKIDVKSNWLDYLIYFFIFAINIYTLIMVFGYFYQRYRQPNVRYSSRST